jgi:type I restriction enzyme S subunit
MTMGRTESVIGPVPDSWTTRRLEEVADFITKGGTPTTYGFDWASPTDGVPFFRSECVTDSGFNPKGMNYIHEQAHQQMSRSEVKPGDLLMTITGNIGRLAVAPSDFESANINQHIARIRILVDAGASASYVYHCLKHDGYATYYRAILTGQAYPQISLQQVRETPVALPPLPEQHKIAAILSVVDDKLDVIARQIGATQTLKQGLMQTLFSRGVGAEVANGRWVPHAEFKDSELGEIPATWVLTTLGSVCDGALQTGPFGSQLHANEYQDDGVPVLMPKDLMKCRATLATAARISPARAEELSKHELFVGDLLFSRRGDVARFALIDEESAGALCGTGCLRARPSAAHSSTFIAHLLQLDVVRAWLEQNAVGQTMPNMNTGILSSLPLIVPAGRQEQDEIALILDSVDSKLQVLAAKQSHHQALKRGLMQKLLAGEWRVSLDASATGT